MVMAKKCCWSGPHWATGGALCMPVTDPGSLPRAWSVIAGRDNKGPWGALEFKLRQNAMQLVCAPLAHRRWGSGVCAVCVLGPGPSALFLFPVHLPHPLLGVHRAVLGAPGRMPGSLGVWVSGCLGLRHWPRPLRHHISAGFV